MSKIEQIITEIEEYIDNCKFQPLSTSKVICKIKMKLMNCWQNLGLEHRMKLRSIRRLLLIRTLS